MVVFFKIQVKLDIIQFLDLNTVPLFILVYHFLKLCWLNVFYFYKKIILLL